MTAPIQSGYPDYGRFQAQSTKIYARATLGPTIAPTDVDLGYVGDIPYLGVSLADTLFNWTIRIGFYTDATYTTLLMSHNIQMRANDGFARTVPVLGPYCRVHFTPLGGAGTIFYQFIQAVTSYGPLDDGSLANVLFATFNTAFVAGTTFVEGVDIWQGEAVFYVELPGVNSDVRLNAVSAGGTTTVLTRVAGNGITAERRIFLPAQHLEVQVINTGAGPANFTFILSAKILE